MTAILKCTISTAFLFCSIISAAQQQSPENKIPNGVLVKISPLSLMETFNTLMLGVEVPLAKSKFSLNQDVGYGHTNYSVWYAEDEKRPDRTHIRANTQVRFYFFEWHNGRLFAAGEYFMRYAKSNAERFICSGFECDSYEEKIFQSSRMVNALHAQFGIQFWPSRRAALDFFVATGFRRVNNKILTPGTSNEHYSMSTIKHWEWLEVNKPGVFGPNLSFHTGVKLGVRIGN